MPSLQDVWKYDLTRVSAPVAILQVSEDIFSQPRDYKRIRNQLCSNIIGGNLSPHKCRWTSLGKFKVSAYGQVFLFGSTGRDPQDFLSRFNFRTLTDSVEYTRTFDSISDAFEVNIPNYQHVDPVVGRNNAALFANAYYMIMREFDISMDSTSRDVLGYVDADFSHLTPQTCA